MQLEFKATQQSLIRIDRQVPIATSENYLYAHFDLPEEYDGTLTANFEITIDSVIYGAAMEVDAITHICQMPNTLVSAGNLKVSLSSLDESQYIPTNAVIVPILASGVPETLLNLPGEHPTELQTFIEMYNELKGLVEPTNLLALIETIDGTGSLLDADLLDGLHASATDVSNTVVARTATNGIAVRSIDFSNVGVTPADRRAWWNQDYLTVSIGTTDGSSIEVGQENVFPVVNDTAQTITNGNLVSWTQAQGASGKLKVQKFIANGTIPAEKCLGIATNTLSPNETGHAGWFGKLGGLNTTGTPYGEVWAEGDIIYASATIAGGMTKVRPNFPNYVIRLGVVTTRHQTQGVMVIRPVFYPIANQILITDTTNKFTAIDVEGALVELEARIKALEV